MFEEGNKMKILSIVTLNLLLAIAIVNTQDSLLMIPNYFANSSLYYSSLPSCINLPDLSYICQQQIF